MSSLGYFVFTSDVFTCTLVVLYYGDECTLYKLRLCCIFNSFVNTVTFLVDFFNVLVINIDGQPKVLLT